MKLITGFALLSMPIVACTSTTLDAPTGPVKQYAVAPTNLTAEQGKFLVQPKHVVKAHSDTMTCWVPDWVPDQDYMVTHFEPLQGANGHHLLALRSGSSYKPGTVFDCTDVAQMVDLQPLVLPELSDTPLLPDGYAVKLPKDAHIVMQSHYLNTTDQDIETQDVGVFKFAPAGTKPQEVSYLVLNDGGIKLPAGQALTRTTKCKIPGDIKLLTVMGHMHQWGKSVTLDLERAATPGKIDNLYKVDPWQAQYRDKPPLTNYGLANALQLAPGDTYSITCSWNNSTAADIKFPHEMCASVAYYFPARPEGLIVCDNE